MGNAVSRKYKSGEIVIKGDRLRNVGSAYVIKRPSVPERILRKVVDLFNADQAPDNGPRSIHVGSTVETKSSRGFFGIRTRD